MLKIIFALLALAVGFNSFGVEPALSSPNKIRSIQPGISMPEVTLSTIDGKSVSLASQLDGKPAIIVFYQEGWCPYCNLQLGGLKKIKGQLDNLGFRLLAVSSDQPETLKASLGKHNLDYTLLSDTKSDAARAFRMALYPYNAGVEKASAETRHTLSASGIFIADRALKLRFSYVNLANNTHFPESEILDAAKMIAENR